MNNKDNKASKLFFFLLGEKAAKSGLDLIEFQMPINTPNIFKFFLDGWNNYKESQIKETNQNEN